MIHLDSNFLTDICGIHYPDRKGEELCGLYAAQPCSKHG